MVSSIIENIKVRFKDLGDELKSTMIGSLRNWPSTQYEGFKNDSSELSSKFCFVLLCFYFVVMLLVYDFIFLVQGP